MMESSWKNIETEIFNYYQNETDEISDSTKHFLELIDFLNDGELTDLGRRYLDSKYIIETDEHERILRSELLKLPDIASVCQAFYGQETQRENVERFFKSKTDVADSTEVGRILGLMNNVDIVDYSKRNGTVQFKETTEVEKEDRESYRITHRTPFSNLARFRKALRLCEGDVLWVDQHWSKKGLEPLGEELTGEQFKSIRVLTGPAHVSTHMRDDFKRFKEEMEYRGIDAAIRVITDETKLRDIHDRWILSEGASWNVPPINSIYGNQESEILKTNKNLEFEDWWDSAFDILDDWNDIQAYI